MLLGSHFLHPDRFLYGRLSFSVELVYRRNPTGGFDLNAARDRVRLARGKGAKVALRVDDAPGQSLPVNGDEAGAHAYAQWCQMLATDHIMRDCDWLICGNEPNLVAEKTPEQDYASGWWQQLVSYVNKLPNVMGLAAFVDQDYGAGWANTAMTSGLGRCPQWNTDHDALLRDGWS